MMPFQLTTVTKAKVLGVFVLSQKNRQPDEDPGAKLTLQAKVSNDVLTSFDGALKSFLFTRDASQHGDARQAQLEGVPPISDLPNLTAVGSHVKALKWVDKLTGYRLVIDYGTGGRSNIEVDDCELSNFKMEPEEGGTVSIKFDLESPNVSEKTWGKLAKLKSIEVEILLFAPEVAQQEIDGGTESWSAPPHRYPKPDPAASSDATTAFLAAHKEV